MNYTQLYETIKGYCENDFPSTSFTGSDGSTVSLTSTEQVNRFILLAEQKIFNSVQILNLRKNVTGTVTTDTPYLKTPSDWLANFSLGC